MCRERTLRQLERQDLLILGEFGYVPFSKTAAELLFEVVSRAYERQSLAITTNLPFESWTEVLGCERLTGALSVTKRPSSLDSSKDCPLKKLPTGLASLKQIQTIVL